MRRFLFLAFASALFVLCGCVHQPGVGEDAHVRASAGGTTVLAASVIDDLAAAQRDPSARSRLQRDSRVVPLPNGTLVHTLHAYIGYWDVRVLAGQYKDLELWIGWDDLVS